MPSPKVKTAGEPEVSTAVKTLREGNNNVYYEKSVTKNMGNYESCKITVGVTLPVCPTKEECDAVKRTFEIGDELVTSELEVQLKELTTSSSK